VGSTLLWSPDAQTKEEVMRARVVVFILAVFAGGCSDGEPETARLEAAATDHEAVARGREVWFENTYGAERFWSLLPGPPWNIPVAFEQLVNTPRAERFAQWGVINDPDCRANPAGGMDLCDDPNATGIVGIRVFPRADGTRGFAIACASCHAGFDPLKPPKNPAAPTWDNIHPTIGNQYAKFRKIFSEGMAPTDPRRLMFAAWPDGVVDTTALFPDYIDNPGVVTAFWNHPYRPTFDVGLGEDKMRNGQGGEDDLGGDVAAVRVYTNIGVCFVECVLGPMQANQPIDVEACYQTCDDMPPEQDIDDLVTFLGSVKAPVYPAAPTNPIDYLAGALVFHHQCESCHSADGRQRKVLSDDEVQPLVDDPVNATNACRSLSTNWEAGRLWAEFSSDVYKARVAAGDRGYRTMPLTAIWSTTPFLHNQSIGGWAPATATPSQRAQSYRDAMWELLRDDRTPVIHTLPVAVGPFPAGTPLHQVFSRHPVTGEVLCTDYVENKGHTYGADLSRWQKSALIYWLQFQ
jgi:mono/diheme cytochrome c family protein